MAIDPQRLEARVAEFVAPMTSIRGRRMTRILRRAFAEVDAVFIAELADGRAGFLGARRDGLLVFCASDGRGRCAEVLTFRADAAARLSEGYDLLKDSIPVIAAAFSHPALAESGALILPAPTTEEASADLEVLRCAVAGAP